jgi:hypothetical protein
MEPSLYGAVYRPAGASINTFEYAGAAMTEPRAHPWIDAVDNPSCCYYDLTRTPALIRSALEDFTPWANYAAIQDFYALLEAINQTRSPFETNDCAFTGPQADGEAGAHDALQCSGRLMLLFRALERNVVAGEIEQLKNQLHHQLMRLDPNFRAGAVGTTLIPVHYLALEQRGSAHLGWQLMVSFWAWGCSEADAMRNLARLFASVAQALRALSSATTRASAVQ